MTREEFKRRWEKNKSGDGITMSDIANCAKEWGISQRPMTRPMDLITYLVLKEAKVKDAEEYKVE